MSLEAYISNQTHYNYLSPKTQKIFKRKVIEQLPKLSSNEELKQWLQEKASNTKRICTLNWWYKRGALNYLEHVKEITSHFNAECNYKERVYCIVNDLYEPPKCKQCNKTLKYYVGYKTFCSDKCALKNEDVRVAQKESKVKNKTPNHQNNKHLLLLENFDEIYQEYHIKKKLSCNQISEIFDTHLTYFASLCRKFNKEIFSYRTTYPHRVIEDFLIANKIRFITNSRDIIKPKELDIYLPEYNLAIEVNGVYWHENKHHTEKLNLCEQNKIRLLQFWDLEITQNTNLVLSILKTQLHLCSNSYQARKCIIKRINAKECKDFFNNNHLQKFKAASVYYGLYYNNTLISCMSFNKHSKYQWELTRFCNLQDTNVVGGASRLFKQFIKDYNPTIILSFCDRRIFSGNIYPILGFALDSITLPNYFYVKGNKIFSRLKFQKHKLNKILPVFNINLSEYTNMKNNGYLRIFDCGNSKFLWYKNQ